jgi:hypothetical protein
MESEEFVETFRLQLFVSLISALLCTDPGRAYLEENNPVGMYEREGKGREREKNREGGRRLSLDVRK